MTLIRDVVVPVVEAELNTNGTAKYKGFLGSSFRLANSDFIVTAKHVLSGQNPPIFMYVHDARWKFAVGTVVALHDTFDIALCRANMIDLPPSFIEIDGCPQNASLDYQCWGYPADHMHDFNVIGPGGAVQEIPDLVFTKGYVRRRFNHGIPGIHGTNFYELSDIAGRGCSGSPVIRQVVNSSTREVDWYAFGVYVGERHIERNGHTRSLAYAVALDYLSEWFRDQGVILSGG